MDFSKLKEGVIALSTFLASHMVWLAFTIYSIHAAFGSQMEARIVEISVAVIQTLQSNIAKLLIETYGLKPLIPTFSLFVIVFILHANRVLLEETGRYVPPELVWNSMPGIRDIDPSRWRYVLGELGSEFSFDKVLMLVADRYTEARKEYNYSNYLAVFNIFKSLAFINAILGLASIRSLNIMTLLSFIFCSAVAALIALLQIYHESNKSRWAIDKLLNKLIVENASESNQDKGNEQVIVWLDDESGKAENFWNSVKKQPIITLSWSLPLVGNIRILKQSFDRRTR